ncbi:SAR2788 family putative toxin [Paenibacillus alvei]|nr:SAR2788 family putative toxin [Paenibacillus alvei]EJW19400.1 hypothetical protein PAV_1c03740 [Paenibacillus alvei DSM 29]MCY9542811.1 SAR2788 family putative toxin [Paenibacillus alvei]MCY9707359.1 SAR2788 family putative toxin [Paenibacillus alvei]MCY9737587.1 SAR2788 family putative toxin [Paenibacillus alvei]MEC0083679.1 SAR2788 family putative toxin [Paenibacillus alvei]
MRISKSIMRTLVASILATVMFLCFSVQPQVYAESHQTDSFASNYQVISDNDQELVIETSLREPVNSSYSSYFNENEKVTGNMKVDKKTGKIVLTTNEKSELTNETGRTYSVVINDIKEDGEINATFIDVETNKTYDINQDKFVPTLVWFVPIGVIIGEWLLGQLLAAGTAMLIAGVTYVALNEAGVLSKLREDKTANHFMAKIIGGKVWVGDGMSLEAAAFRLVNPMLVKAEQNVWSKSSAYADLVARTAGGGKESKGPELTCDQLPGFFYYAHYHTHDRTGGHSFF